MSSVIFKICARIIFPLLLLMGFYLYWRGHQAPGGGFIAGLVIAAGFAATLLNSHSKLNPKTVSKYSPYVIATGLTLALLAGLIGFAQDMPFMTGRWASTALPLLGIVGTPMLFDLGVLLVVVGVSLHILVALIPTAGDKA